MGGEYNIQRPFKDTCGDVSYISTKKVPLQKLYKEAASALQNMEVET